MTYLLYLTFSWPLSWIIDFRPQINPTFEVWPKLNIYFAYYKQNTFGHFHRNFIEIGARPWFRLHSINTVSLCTLVPLNLANFKQLYLEIGLTYETETSTKLKMLISSFYWCVRPWSLTFEIWHMTNPFYLTSTWPLTWSMDFRPQINPSFQVWPKLNIYFDFYMQNTFGHFHRNFIEIGARP